MLDPAPPRPTRDIIQRAAQWAAELDDVRVAPARRLACEAWCAEDMRHRLALDRIRGFDDRFGALDTVEQAALSRTARALGSRRKGSALGASILGLALFGWFAAQSLTLRQYWPDQRTTTGEIRTLALDDGSTLHLDTASSIDRRFAASERRIGLFRGQLMAQVASDRSRPFIVETEDGTATALGTAFTVRKEADATIVTVIESRVRVCARRLWAETCADLGAGQAAHLSHGAVTRLASVNPQQAASWTRGWIEADDMPLDRLLTELNRYRSRPVTFDAQRLSALRITGSFPLTDPDRALSAIVETSRLRAENGPHGIDVNPRR